VIEDDHGVLHFVKHVLEASGYQVLATTDSRQAVELIPLHGEEIQAALIDVTMPTINGIDLARLLRQRLPELPILLMSGYSEEEVFQKLAGLKVNGFLHKPFRAKDMTTQLGEIIAAARSQA
jgi:CheY-like chemotaxis protein